MAKATRSRPSCAAACPGMIGPHEWQYGHCTAPHPSENSGAVYVSADGAVFRDKSRWNALNDRWDKRYAVLTIEGTQSVAYALPDDAKLVWSPPGAAQPAAESNVG